MSLENNLKKDDEALNLLISLTDKIPFFSFLNKTEINELITEVRFFTYKNKDIIFNEGEINNDYIYYLLKGKIQIKKYYKNTSLKTTIAIINKPSLFGEMMRITGEPRSATVESSEDKTLVLAFKIREFEESQTIAKFYKNVIIELTNKIKDMNDKYLS
jgi:CRP-like cAMP-binding protein